MFSPFEEQMTAKGTKGKNGESDVTIEGRYERIEEAERARQALLARPRFSLRLQIYLAFFLVFILSLGFAAALMVAIHTVEQKVNLLGIANDYVVEVEQTRRFEKNFFLYGTGLNEALESIYQARRIFEQSARDIEAIIGPENLRTILSNIGEYTELLEELAKVEQKQGESGYAIRKKELEQEVRRQGHRMISFAEDLMKKEKEAISAAMSWSRVMNLYLLLVLLISMTAISYILGSRLLKSLSRFEIYAHRIAAGDFRPITPARKYRDEFTDLALSINQMMQELEKHETVLIQSHKMRAVGTLTAGIAHELNNPLNNVTLTAHMLMEDFDELTDEQRKEFVTDIIDEADRARRIVSNLLDFARESGTQLEPLDLPSLLKDTISLVSNQAKLAGIRIDFQRSDQLPRIHGDRQQLRQVFLNLLLNAIAASEKGDKIDVEAHTTEEPEEVAVKVIDYGSGIPEHILHRIFDPFFTTKAKGKGTGLGLSVSQGIIAKHGGRIHVSSREGEGSTFTVSLPVTTLGYAESASPPSLV